MCLQVCTGLMSKSQFRIVLSPLKLNIFKITVRLQDLAMKSFHSEKQPSILKKGIVFPKYCIVTNFVGVFFQGMILLGLAVLESRAHSKILKVTLIMNPMNN